MTVLGFGQPVGGVVQMGYVVRDLAEAMDRFTALLGAGPWFVIRRFNGLDARHEGQPALSLSDIALGFAGHMQIELICPVDEHPSVYRGADGALLEGFHHFGIAAGDFDAACQDAEARGFVRRFEAVVPSGGRVAYYDTHGQMPGMLEYIEADAAFDEHFTAMYRAGVDWDGGDPVRAMGDA